MSRINGCWLLKKGPYCNASRGCPRLGLSRCRCLGECVIAIYIWLLSICTRRTERPLLYILPWHITYRLAMMRIRVHNSAWSATDHTYMRCSEQSMQQALCRGAAHSVAHEVSKRYHYPTVVHAVSAACNNSRSYHSPTSAAADIRSCSLLPACLCYDWPNHQVYHYYVYNDLLLCAMR